MPTGADHEVGLLPHRERRDGLVHLPVEVEQRDPDSTLRQYEQMLALRRMKRDLRTDDDFSIEQTEGLITIRRGKHFTALINCSSETAVVKSRHVVLVRSDAGVESDGTSLTLPPASGAWIDI